ncbi:MAG: Asp-tRNA(Asn)/Glu-tRNA(Gln) amidotransferase subunit GatA, partial [Lachnoclostridium sp.]|nr:Asp-tRNA(Asn)/Glu-tRNA(Gln) amidotransferase subunit GatA [Lachnoclostridium sp.]
YEIRNKNLLDDLCSGSAKAVADGVVSYALGSDSNGSRHLAAIRNGISFIKPTYGTVSRYGLVANASSMEQIGVYTKSIREGFQVLENIAGYDEKDGTSYQTKSYQYQSTMNDAKGIKIGIPSECFCEDKGFESIQQQKFISKLRGFGANIRELEFAYLELIEDIGLILSSAEFSNNISRFDGIKYGYRTKNYKNVDDLIVNSRTESFELETKLKAMLGSFVLSEGNYKQYYEKAMQIRQLIKEEMDRAFALCDVLMIPVSKEETSSSNKSAYPVLSLGNLTGCPVLSVPYERKENGTCSGVQLIAKEFNENILWRLGGAFDEI